MKTQDSPDALNDTKRREDILNSMNECSEADTKRRAKNSTNERFERGLEK